MKYNKLIRDKIPEILDTKGKKYTTHIAGNEEYSKKLLEKLQEEVDEFKDEPNQEELADILEVIDAICNFKNFDKKEIANIKSKKTRDRGAFKKKIILEEVK